jgi:hypothetical protein
LGDKKVKDFKLLEEKRLSKAQSKTA